MNIVIETKLSYPVFKKGKVRDVYDVGDHLLLVVTDRIS
ncbi:MAG: phosphoribosylaminoimidazolesuccinocarboxamide synthase, partial [Thermoplasmatota archaeon]